MPEVWAARQGPRAGGRHVGQLTARNGKSLVRAALSNSASTEPRTKKAAASCPRSAAACRRHQQACNVRAKGDLAFADLFQRHGSTAADAATVDYQAADLAAELAIQPVSVHRLVEVSDRQRAAVGGHGAHIVSCPAVQGDGGGTRLVLRPAEVPTDVVGCFSCVVRHGETGPLADDQLAGRAVILHAVRPLIHGQPQAAVAMADQVDP